MLLTHYIVKGFNNYFIDNLINIVKI